MKKPSSEVQTQINNILETLKNFGRSDADSDEIGDYLFEELRRDDAKSPPTALSGFFVEFAYMLQDVRTRLIDARENDEE